MPCDDSPHACFAARLLDGGRFVDFKLISLPVDNDTQSACVFLRRM